MNKATRKPKSKAVTIVIRQKDYDHAISSGINPNEVLRPGTYVGRRDVEIVSGYRKMKP